MNSRMKKRTIRRIVSLMACLVAGPSVWAQTNSVGVGVPDKDAAGEFAISQMDLVLQVDSAAPIQFRITPPAGSFQDTVSLSPGAAVPSPMLFGADFVRVFPPDGSLDANDPRRRNYRIRIQPTSDFDIACQSAMTADETWQIDVVGGTNRLENACLVSFDENTAMNACGGFMRVVPSSEDVATLSGLSAAEQTCRFGVEAMLSLDRSGSMGGRARPAEPSGPTNQKIVSLRNAVTSFTTALEDVRSTEAANGLTVPADEIGIAVFNSNATDLPGVSAGLNVFNATLKSDIDTQLGTVAASGSTSIGDGLIHAAGALGGADPSKRRVVLLMSDGKQNNDQRVSVIGDQIVTHPSTTACPGGSADPDCDLLPNDGTFDVCAVTVGTSTAVDPAINQAVALAGNCFYLNSEDDASEMSTFFLNVLQNFLETSSWQTLLAGPGVAGPVSGSPLTVPVTSTSSALSVTLTPQAGDFLCMNVLAPGQTATDPICDDGVLSFSRAISQMPAGDMGGDWRLDIWAPRSSPNEPAGFYVMVLADDHGTHAGTEIEATDFAPLEPITVRLRLEEFDEPLTGLAGPDIRLQLGEPMITVGDHMAETDPSTGGAPEPDSDESATAIQNAVESDPSVVLDNETAILLSEVKPGLYEAQFSIDKHGNSDLLITATGDAPKGGTFTRQVRQTIFVEASVDKERSELDTKVSATAGGGTMSILYTPKTAAGHLAGTGFGNHIWLTGPGVTPFKLNDNLNGTYSGALSFSGTSSPPLSVHVMPHTVSISDQVPPDKLPAPLDASTGVGSVPPTSTVASGRYPWSIGGHVGVTSPQGSAGNVLDGDLAWGLSLEYRFNPTWAAELYAGEDGFDASGLGASVDATRVSLTGKVYFTPGPLRGYAGLGVGTYDFSPGPSETGISALLGVAWENWPRTTLDARVNYHSVDVSGSSFEYFTFQVGVTYRF